MGFRELVGRVQRYSGFSIQESRDALELMVESIAVRLDEGIRRDFASQLPEFLSDMALSVYPSEENTRGDIVNQFMEFEDLEEGRANKQVKAAWRALKDAISEVHINQIKAHLPYASSSLLN